MNAKNDMLIFELCRDPKYLIKDDGTIFRKVKQTEAHPDGWRQTGCSVMTGGYLGLKYKGTMLQVSRIIWANFKKYLRADLEVNHLSGIKSDNTVSNLELCTSSTNKKHGYRYLGWKPRRGNARLSWEKVDQIRKDRRAGYTLRKISESQEVPYESVRRVVNGDTYPEHLRGSSHDED